jgi:hypothetical protein
VPTSEQRISSDYPFLNELLQVMPSISSEFQKFHQASWLGTAWVQTGLKIFAMFDFFPGIY